MRKKTIQKQTEKIRERSEGVMDDSELERRKASAVNETLVIAPTEGGFRVYSPANITHIFMVSGIPDSPQCNCGEFAAKKSDPEWRCKHILAVLIQNSQDMFAAPLRIAFLGFEFSAVALR